MQRISTRLRVWCFPYLRACMAAKHQKGAFAVSVNRYERLNEEHRYHQVKKRVAAYCRVSTDHEDQANSFESQQRYFRQYIQYHPDWELYDIFADEGLSGTTTKKRREFNRMIACAENGEIDLIITKEISRFARNTLDSISYTRELKRHGVGVIFMSDNINTLDGDAELRLAIMSSIAQEESRKTSERVKWGQKRRMEQGIVFGRSMLGYDVKDGKMTINEDGAEVVLHQQWLFLMRRHSTLQIQLLKVLYLLLCLLCLELVGNYSLFLHLMALQKDQKDTGIIIKLDSYKKLVVMTVQLYCMMLRGGKFKDYVKEHVLDYLPAKYEEAKVYIRQSVKNNGVVWRKGSSYNLVCNTQEASSNRR